MARLYLLGGDNVRERTSMPIMARALEDAGEHTTVLVFPWSDDTIDSEGEYRALISEYFMDLGLESVQFAEVHDPFGAISKKARTSDLIYLPGGNPKLLTDRMLLSRADEVLADFGGTIIGNSAGALGLCRKYVAIVGQGDASLTRFFNGFGDLEFAVAVHYGCCQGTRVDRERHDAELIALSDRSLTKIYAIADDSAIVYDRGRMEFIGDVFQFYRGRKLHCEPCTLAGQES